MLNDTDATAMLAVKDIGVATKFYEGTLGFEPSGREQEGMVQYTMGRTSGSGLRVRVRRDQPGERAGVGRG